MLKSVGRDDTRIRTARAAAAVLCFAWAACVPALEAPAAEIVTGSGAAGKKIVVEVVPGSAWVGTGGPGRASFNVTPQIAVWTEDTSGRLLETLFVTRKFARQQWGGSWPSFRDNETFRLGALPVWLHRLKDRGLPSPTENDPLPDAVTAATPRDGFMLRTQTQGSGEIFVLLEVNNAFDETEVWPNDAPEEGAMYVGQPAVVWKAKVNLSRPGTYPMTLAGHSNWAGKDGKISLELDSLPTAVKIVKEARVRVE